MIWPFNRPALNPARTAAARHDFDVARGFDRYAAHCQRVAPRPAIASDLQRLGVEIVSAPAVTEIGPVLDALDQKIAGHFGSEYLVCSYAEHRTPPARKEARSFLWHCDRGPKRFLKVLLYLNDGHGGNTEFLDRAATAELEHVGYVFGPNRRRLSDLSGIARRHGIPYQPRRWPIQAGQAFLFEPSGVLHRGIVPTIAERRTLSIMLVPSPIPWREALDRYQPRHDGVFPASADMLPQ